MRDRLSSLIQFSGLSQKEFAESVGISGSAITEFIKGRSKKLTSETLSNINEKYNININWLLTGHGSMFLDKEPDTKENMSGLTGIDGNVDTYPQVDHVTKIARTKWWEGLSAVKKFIIAGLDEIEDEEFLSMTKNNINFEVLKERAEKEEAEKEKLKQKGAAG